MRVRHSVIKAIRDFFDGRDFVLMDPPILTPEALKELQRYLKQNISILEKLISRSLGNSTLKQAQWRWVRCMLSDRPSVLKNLKRVAT